MVIEVGQKIFNRGDMANHPHFGVVVETENNGWGEQVRIEVDSDDWDYWVSASSICDVDKGHCGTRIVTIEAYNDRNSK